MPFPVARLMLLCSTVMYYRLVGSHLCQASLILRISSDRDLQTKTIIYSSAYAVWESLKKFKDAHASDILSGKIFRKIGVEYQLEKLKKATQETAENISKTVGHSA